MHRSVKRKLSPPSIAPAWQWIHQPIWPNTAIPDGFPGLLLIGDTVFMVSAHIDGTANRVTGFRLTQSDGATFDVDTQSWACSCSDGQGCQHSSALLGALKQVLTPDAADDARRYHEATDDSWDDPEFARWTLPIGDPDEAA